LPVKFNIRHPKQFDLYRQAKLMLWYYRANPWFYFSW